MKLPLKPRSAGSAPRDRWQVGTEAWDGLMEKNPMSSHQKLVGCLVPAPMDVPCNNS